MRRPINSVNGTYRDPNRSYSAQDALNVIPMMAEKGGTRTLSKYVDAPGLKPFCRIGQNGGGGVGFVAAGAGRGMRVVDGKLYVVAGRNLWQITSAGVSVNYGTIPGVGRVSMAHNQRGLGNELAIDNGQSRYVFNTQTQDLQKVTDESFPGSVKSFFIDGYIGYIEPQGRYWGHSDLSNALSYNSFDEYEAEGQPDRIVTGHVSNREVLIAGQDTIEAYVNSPSGSGEAPFVRATNTVIPSGCSARDSFCNVGLFTAFLDQNRTVQVLNGYTPVPVSTSVIDTALQSCTKQQIANAYAFSLEAEGFQIYYLTVPGKFTFGYDFKNKEWHRRSSTGLDWWAVVDVVQWNGKWYALDSRRGDILELRWRDYPFDVQEELVREWVTGTVSADQNPVFVHELELLFGCGGQEYTTVDFPDQPLGPALSGAAPDGTVGEAYTYTYTVDPGDSPVSRVRLMEGVLLDGLTWDQYTYTISGTPTESGSMDLRFRAFDTAGLWDELEDAIEITRLMMATRVTAGGSFGYFMQIDSGWSGSWQTSADFSGRTLYQLKAGDKTLSYRELTSVVRTADQGTTTALSTGVSMGSGGFLLGWASGDVVLIPGGSGQIRKSVDGGDSFSSVSGSPALGAICRNEVSGRWIGMNDSGKLWYSDDDGDTWSEGSTIANVTPSLYLCRWSDSAGGVVFGTSTGFPYAPKAFTTSDGVTYTIQTFPAFASGSSGFTAAYEYGNYRILATDKGEVVYRPVGESWVLSSGSMGCRVLQISDNGLEVVMIGGIGPEDSSGFIKSTADLETFTTRITASLSVGERWAGITA